MGVEGSQLTLAEELFLLAFDEEKGRDRSAWGIDHGLAGALLLELAARGCVEARDEVLVPADCSVPREPLLAEALNVLRESEQPREAKYWVGELRKLRPKGGGWTAPGLRLKRRVGEQLVERGVLSQRRHKLLGLVPMRRYPEVDPAAERELRGRLEALLLGEAEADSRTALLVSLLAPLGLMKKLVPKDRREAAEHRAKEVVDRGVVGSAVEGSVEEVRAAAVAGVIAAAASGAIAGSNGSAGG